MSRPLRIEYPGALYHVTSRGNARGDIYRCDEDRERFLQMFREEIERQGWICYAYCLMDNHYHLLFETPEGNLCRGMQRMNGRYTQYFNHKHDRVGHLFQGRYKAILVEKDAHLLELCRYVVLNLVRANMVDDVGDWVWSSYAAICDDDIEDSWVAVNVVLSLFGNSLNQAIASYKQFVNAGVGIVSPWEQLRGQIYLGGDNFVGGLQSRIDDCALDRDITVKQRHPMRPDVDTVLRTVMAYYGMDEASLLDKRNKKPFRNIVFLLRRVCCSPLKDVACMAGISEGRVSQIYRAMMENDMERDIEILLEKFNV
ncbi:MAG: transposase [Mariprofundaceae bacterium]|nr:transposase [Mariprofundaceae bacterium]